MSKLQSDFTTIEQSKRLLELGVPADSADCYYTAYGLISVIMPCVNDKPFLYEVGCTPCWSVGRLIEIIKICSKPKEQATISEELLYCRDLVGMLVFILEGNRSVIDFSKLEE